MPDQQHSVPESAVEAAAEALWNEHEYRDPTGDPPDDWCPPGHDVHQRPPNEPDLWAPLAAAGKYPASLEETRADAKSAVTAALPHIIAAYEEQPNVLSMEEAEIVCEMVMPQTKPIRMVDGSIALKARLRCALRESEWADRQTKGENQ